MRYKIYQVDAFANEMFGGNPAAVVPLEDWISDELMQKIAAENNLAETAFYVGANGSYHIRWFTPIKEVNLCGHATLASAFIVNHIANEPYELMKFKSRGGDLQVMFKDGNYVLDFPVAELTEITTPDWVTAVGLPIMKTLKSGEDYMLVLNSEQEVRICTPNLLELSKVKSRGFIITAKGELVDFVSRFFAPGAGIDEDPATGSAHCGLIPFWAQQLNKKTMKAQQLSTRVGHFSCELKEDRVFIGGGVKLYLEGEILID